MPIKKLMLAGATCLAMVTAANAVSLRQVMRDCGDDSRALCAGVGYGDPMQACLSRNKASLSEACKAIVDRLENGEKVRLFG